MLLYSKCVSQKYTNSVLAKSRSIYLSRLRFPAHGLGSLTATERSVKYKAQAVEYADVRDLREFPGPSSKSRKTKEKALCV